MNRLESLLEAFSGGRMTRRGFFATAAMLIAGTSHAGLSDLQVYDLGISLKAGEGSRQERLDQISSQIKNKAGLMQDASWMHYGSDIEIYIDLIARHILGEIRHLPSLDYVMKMDIFFTLMASQVGSRTAQPMYATPKLFRLTANDALTQIYWNLHAADDAYSGFMIEGEAVDMHALSDNVKMNLLMLRGFHTGLMFADSYHLGITDGLKQYLGGGFRKSYASLTETHKNSYEEEVIAKQLGTLPQTTQLIRTSPKIKQAKMHNLEYLMIDTA